jgi:tetratricopeptide (TPR) repeat protein
MDDLLAFALRHLADLQQEVGDFSEADQAIEEAVALYRLLKEDNQLNLANALRIHALVQEALGRSALAIVSWQETHGLFMKSGVTEGVQECQSHLFSLRGHC